MWSHMAYANQANWGRYELDLSHAGCLFIFFKYILFDNFMNLSLKISENLEGIGI